jgi:hypothetical protein
MKKFVNLLLVLMFVTATSGSAFAECTLKRTVCEYPCIEYYPNGTDCRKTKKVCHEVCDDFEVEASHLQDE